MLKNPLRNCFGRVFAIVIAFCLTVRRPNSRHMRPGRANVTPPISAMVLPMGDCLSNVNVQITKYAVFDFWMPRNSWSSGNEYTLPLFGPRLVIPNALRQAGVHVPADTATNILIAEDTMSVAIGDVSSPSKGQKPHARHTGIALFVGLVDL